MLNDWRATLFLIGLLFTCSSMSRAQAIPTAQTTGELDAFGTFSITNPDYGRGWNTGGTVGGDLLLRPFRFGQPGVVFRYANVSGSTTRETFLGGGLDLHYRLPWIRPYATIEYGVGGLAVPEINYSDSGGTVLIGGGADVPLARRFSARGEFTYEFINISGRNGAQAGSLSLTPSTFNIGLVYRIR
jgi:hypothetical protein